jgi:hypothetical protein
MDRDRDDWQRSAGIPIIGREASGIHVFDIEVAPFVHRENVRSKRQIPSVIVDAFAATSFQRKEGYFVYQPNAHERFAVEFGD